VRSHVVSRASCDVVARDLALDELLVERGEAVAGEELERLRHNRSLAATLTGVTAAVVGVIASLALYFAVHTLFAETVAVTTGPFDLEVPVLGSVEPVPLLITLLGCYLVFARRWSVLRTLGACAVAGFVGYGATLVW
jgi:hypothetical protein